MGIKGLTASTTLASTSGAGLKVLVIHTRWNLSIVDTLTAATVAKLIELGVASSDITIKQVPGAYELPFAAQALLKTGAYDAAIAIGVLIKGDTMHFEYIADASTQGLMRVGLDAKLPVIFGILTCLSEEQALLRAGLGGPDGKSGHNHGADWGVAAVEMALLNKL
ncbi:hypothetical protein HK100_001357 [Physocladia obscura]|uniref:6,7-dimethyl-8-ribityllumazine synthase n=1 Tax=Physocladia obscura TaxID=109957 RepID=A0AAD5SYX6_9FUNG|nr:hypothetical protein HK100_001357 [Physocladia obscura]